jgi:hypothetical protein
MTMKNSLSTVALLVIGAAQTVTAVAQAKQIAFVGCPVMRDADLPERPCWLAQDDDKLYFIGMQGDIFPPAIFWPPQLKHKAVVEGEEVDGPDVCGGRPLRNVKVAVVPEIDITCDTVLPKAGFGQGPIARLSPPYRPGRGIATDPKTWPQARAPAPPPVPPFTARSFEIPFLFGEDFIHIDEAFIMGGAIRYFAAIKASKLIVDVPRDQILLSNGQLLDEGEDVARRRASLVINNFREWGVPREKIEIRMTEKAAPGGRHVTLTVQP